MTINEITNECRDKNSSPARTGTCQHSDRAMVLSNTPAVSRKATKAAERNADASHNPGGQGLVKTIFRLRLRKCDETINRPRPPERISILKVKVSKIWRKVLKCSTLES